MDTLVMTYTAGSQAISVDQAAKVLQVLQIGGDHRIAQRPGQADQQADDAIGDAFRRAVKRVEGEPSSIGFSWAPILVAHTDRFSAGALLLPTSASSFSSTRGVVPAPQG
jgi:hypothetical protein